MATRKDLPDNPEMDKHREMMREVVIEYLRKYTAAAERDAIIKAATKEWLDDRFRGIWFSFQAVFALIFVYLVYLYLTSASPNK